MFDESQDSRYLVSATTVPGSGVGVTMVRICGCGGAGTSDKTRAGWPAPSDGAFADVAEVETLVDAVNRCVEFQITLESEHRKSQYRNLRVTDMWWTTLEIALAIIGLATATALWNKIEERGKLVVLGCLMVGIIALSVRSHIATIHDDEVMEKLRFQLQTAEQELAEHELVRRKVIAYGDIAKLNADGSTGMIKKGGGLSGGDTAITPTAEKIWIYSGENNDTRHAKCDEEGMRNATQLTEEHPTFPFSYFVLAVCQRAAGNSEWIASSRRALDILEFTTQVPGHNRHHDTVKKRLTDWMDEAKMR